MSESLPGGGAAPPAGGAGRERVGLVGRRAAVPDGAPPGSGGGRDPSGVDLSGELGAQPARLTRNPRAASLASPDARCVPGTTSTGDGGVTLNDQEQSPARRAAGAARAGTLGAATLTGDERPT